MRIRLLLAAVLAVLSLRAADLVVFDKAKLDAAIALFKEAAVPLPGSPAPPATARKLVAWTAADYAPWQYTGFTVGLTKGGFRLTRDCSDLQFHATGRFRPAGIGSPGQFAEVAGTPYELLVNVEFWDPPRTTRIAGPFHVRWAGHRLLTTLPDVDYYSDVIAGTYQVGTWCEYQSLAWRCPSAGQTIDGEPGQMAVGGAYWPRAEGVGGGLGSFETYGTRFVSDAAPSLAPWVTALDAGTWQHPNPLNTTISSGGWAPVAVTGITATTGQRLSLVQWSDSIARSNDSANRERPESGTGYIRTSTQGLNGGFQASISGQRLADVILEANTVQRWEYQQYADGSVIGLVSNDLKERAIEPVEADFRTFCARLRDAGQTWIAAETCLFRWNSTDSWTTYGNQTEQIAGFNAKALAWDARLGAMLADGTLDQVIDRRPLVQNPAEGFRWRLPVTVETFSTVNPSTMGAPRTTGTSWLKDRFTNRHVSYGTDTTLYPVFGNSTVALTVNAGSSGATAMAAGVPVKILDVFTVDGVHTASYANAVLAQGIPPTTYVP